MSERMTARRGSQQRTRFDDTGRRTIVGVIIGILALAVVIGILVAVSMQNPDLGLTLQLGGPSRAQDIQPRNFRVWAVQPDGRLRFATAFFPSRTNAPASEVFTVAGPLVNKAEDIQQTHYFGALNINSQVQPGTGNDSSRFYKLFWVEHDPQVAAYGVDMMTQKSPYVVADSADKNGKMSYIAMGAPQQTYYAQVIVAVAFPPGAMIDNVAYPLPEASGGTTTETMMRPYRRVTIGGWTVYYFDQTTLAQPQTVRIRYTPPKSPANMPAAFDLNLWEVDRMR